MQATARLERGGDLEQPVLSDESKENEVVQPNIPILDRQLCSLGLGPGGVYSEEWDERLAEFIDEKRSLPSDAKIDIYHGLNGGLDKALALLESPEQGVKQMGGEAACFAIFPVGSFWKPGDAGFKYSIPRESIEFPGENKPDAKFHIDDDGVVLLVNGLDTLPLTEFNGEVMRTERKKDIYEEQEIDGEWKDVLVGKEVVPLSDKEREAGLKIEEQLGKFSQAREAEEVRKLKESIHTMLK
jgi:hypothetical protein